MHYTMLTCSALLTWLLLCSASEQQTAAISAAHEDVSLRQLGEPSHSENSGVHQISGVTLATSGSSDDATVVKVIPSDTQTQIDDVKVTVDLVQSAVRATHSDMSDIKAQLAHLEAGFESMKDEVRQLRSIYREEVETFTSQVVALTSLVYTLEDKVHNNSQVTDSTRRGSSLSICNGTKVEREESGSLAVVVSGHYSANMDCGWRVELPAGVKTLLRWVYFELESEESCKYDYVTLEDLTRPNHLLYG
ncbi:uncharacterized protein [Panulirus ornatus]|uniref:uncharacterized protein n=1 Tax=Panulirus ornatus TaxID=150431 RepID=UPI003A8A8EFD